MNNRLQLQTILEGLVGTKNVYFQPPASVNLIYPCVVYNIGSGNAKYANDTLYVYKHSYNVTFIYKRPNLDIIERVLETLPMSRFDRSFCSDGLNHYIFTIYY